MSKLDDILILERGAYAQLPEVIGADQVAHSKNEIKVLMLDIIIEAAEASNGDASVFLERYREKVKEL